MSWDKILDLRARASKLMAEWERNRCLRGASGADLLCSARLYALLLELLPLGLRVIRWTLATLPVASLAPCDLPNMFSSLLRSHSNQIIRKETKRNETQRNELSGIQSNRIESNRINSNGIGSDPSEFNPIRLTRRPVFVLMDVQ